MTHRTFAIALSFAACTAPVARPEVPLDLTTDRSVVIVVEEKGARRMFARDVKAGEPLPDFEASSADPLRVTTLAFDAPLLALGFAVTNGELTPATMPALSRPLGPWARGQTRTIDLEEDGEWVPLDAERERTLGAVKVAAAKACRSYSGRAYALTSTASFGPAYAEDLDHAVVAQGAKWFRFDRERAVEIEAPVPGLRATAATRSPDGTTFLAGARAGRFEVWSRANGDARFSLLPSTPSMMTSDPSEEIAFLSAQSASLLWTMTQGGHLAAFVGDRWVDHDLLPHVDLLSGRGGLHVVENGVDVLHPFDLERNDVRYVTQVRGGQARPFAITPGSATVLPTAISGNAAGDATFYGGSDGRIYRLISGALVLAADDSETRFTLNHMQPVRSGIWSGVVAVGYFSGAVEVYDNGEVCVTHASAIDAFGVLTLGEDLLVMGTISPVDSDPYRPAAAVLITRGPAP